RPVKAKLRLFTQVGILMLWGCRAFSDHLPLGPRVASYGSCRQPGPWSAPVLPEGCSKTTRSSTLSAPLSSSPNCSARGFGRYSKVLSLKPFSWVQLSMWGWGSASGQAVAKTDAAHHGVATNCVPGRAERPTTSARMAARSWAARIKSVRQRHA
ncbi:hypothetical protein V8C86DRAFT_2459482, partial [Haematococcus lacustris]